MPGTDRRSPNYSRKFQLILLKSFLPIVILLIGSYYGYQWYPYLPDSAAIGITYLNYMLALIVAGLAVRFGRSRVFFYVLLVMAANLSLRLEWAADDLAYALLSAILPFALVTLTMLPDRGLLSLRALPAHVVLLFAFGFIVVASSLAPPWATYLFLSDWAPAQYFGWTEQKQSVLIVTFVSLYLMLTLATMKPSPYLAAGFGVLLMLAVQLHYGGQAFSLNLFSGVALLMCLYAIMQETWRMAYLDELTGLPGRRALSEKFQRIGGTYTVAMLDVDHFKKFNDNFGHDAGDAVLRMISARLNKVQGGGASYRYGGEEFTVVFNGKSAEAAAHHLENLRAEIAAHPFVIRHKSRRNSDKKAEAGANKSVKITVSIGFADSNGKETGPWAVLKLADKALYRAKGKGRNCISE